MPKMLSKYAPFVNNILTFVIKKYVRCFQGTKNDYSIPFSALYCDGKTPYLSLKYFEK